MKLQRLAFSRARLAALTLLATLFVPAVACADPVDDLQQALAVPPRDSINPSELFYRHREETLRQHIARLKTIGELRRALTLKDWKDEPSTADDKGVQKIDTAARRQVAERFVAAVRAVIKGGDPTARLAVANLISEMGPAVRSLGDAKTRGGFARTLTEEVKQLARDENLAVRQEGLRALGNVNTEPAQAIPVFVAALKSDLPGPRRLAAEGLGQMLRVANHLRQRGKELGVEATPAEALTITEQTLRAVTPGLADGDARVRLASAETVLEAARTVSDLAQKPERRDNYPPEGRPLTELDRKLIVEDQEKIRRENAEMVPILRAFRDLNGPLARAAQDPDGQVQQTAVEALDSIGYARARLRERASSVPTLANQPRTALLQPLDENDPLAGFLKGDYAIVVRLLQTADSGRVRRGAIEFLELLGDAALPALPAIIGATHDPDRFVRWSAARTLGNFPPEQTAPAIPALARLLADPDYNVKLAASAALEAIGPPARDAAAALGQAVLSGDPETRVGAMFALQRLGAGPATAAVPALTEVLTHGDPRVRRIAAQTLAGIGRNAQSAVPPLRRLLGDEDQEVRMAASEALLAILPLPAADAP